MSPSFSILDLCALIKQAGESGVADLSFEGFSVTFQPSIAATVPQYAFSHAKPQAVVLDQPESESRELAKEELRIREDQLSMALIENPAEYERMLMAGELEDDAAVQD